MFANPESCCTAKIIFQVFTCTTSLILTSYPTTKMVHVQLPKKTRQTSDGSFSAVSTATIASKDAFFCIFRDLQDLHPFAPLRSQNLQIFSFFRAKKKCVHVFFARRGDCRSRKMQKNACLLDIVAVYTAENEPSKV